MKILIIRLSSLGDIVLTEPVCAVLHKAYPDAELHYVCKPAFADLPALFATPVQVIPYDRSISFHRELRKTKYDIVIDLHGKLASIILRLTTRAKRKVGYNKQRSLRQAIVKGKHELAIDSTVQLYMSSLAKLGLDTAWDYPRLKPVTSTIKTGAVAIIPGATYYTKRYPTEQWIQLVKLNPQLQFSLFGSAYDMETCNQISASSPANCTSFAGMFGFEDLLNALNSCALVISGDTGPMHLAAALSIPLIAIFGGTHPRLGFRPLNDKAKVLCADLDCQPCSLHGESSCPLGHFNCMKQISPELVSSYIPELAGK